MDLRHVCAQALVRCRNQAKRTLPGAGSLCARALLSLAALALCAGPALAADTFPRGPGFYFSIPKLISLIVVYVAWLATCSWIDRDSYGLRIPSESWNLAAFGCGAIGIFLCWTLPYFWFSFVILLLLFAAPSLIYVNVRNQRVPEEERVLTSNHFADLAERFLKLRLRRG
jgi:hypothetical protein